MKKLPYSYALEFENGKTISMDAVVYIEEPYLSIDGKKITYHFLIHLISGTHIKIEFPVSYKYHIKAKFFKIPYSHKDYINDPDAIRNGETQYKICCARFKKYLKRK